MIEIDPDLSVVTVNVNRIRIFGDQRLSGHKRKYTYIVFYKTEKNEHLVNCKQKNAAHCFINIRLK